MFWTDGKIDGGMMALRRLGSNGVTCRRVSSRFGMGGGCSPVGGVPLAITAIILSFKPPG